MKSVIREKKRILSLFIVLVMTLGLMPMSVFAEGDENLITEIGISVDGAAEVGIGRNITVKSDITLANSELPATNDTLEWKCAGTAAEIDQQGVVKGLEEGEVTVTASSKDGSSITSNSLTIQVKKVAVSNVTLSENTLDLIHGYKEGGTHQLTATLEPTDATDKDIVWSVKAGDDVVTVSSTGLVTAVKAGEATVTATAGEKSADCVVTVKEYKKVSEITDNSSPVTVKDGKTIQLLWNVKPDGATFPEIKWTSGDEDTATVDADGKVTGVFPGTVKITGTSVDNPDAKLELDIEVTEEGVAEVTIAPLGGAPEVKVNKELQLEAVVTPENATYPQVTWESNAPEVASVSATGLVKGLKASDTPVTITVKSEKYPEKYSDITITVKDVPITRMNFSKPEVKILHSYTLDLNTLLAVEPAGEYTEAIKWTSDAPDKVSVDQATGIIEALEVSEDTIITAESASGSFTASINIDVLERIPVKSIEMKPESPQSVKHRETATLLWTVASEDPDVEPTNTEVKWTISGDDTIASVDANGVVTGNKPGKVEITGTCTDDPTKCVTFEFTVNAILVNSVTFENVNDPLGIPIWAEQETKLNAIVLPADASNMDLEWKSSLPAVASVDQEGNVKGLTAGSTVITATAKDGSGEKATCTVNVAVKVTGVELDIKVVEKLLTGYKVKLTATVLPENAQFKNVVWSSGDDDIATVNQDGQVTGISPGDVVITAKTEEGDFTDTCSITVVQRTPVEGIEWNAAPSTEMSVGDSVDLDWKVLPVDASNSKVVWTSNSEAVTVNEAGKLVANSVGKATITGTSEDDDTVKISFDVTVKAAAVPVTEVTLSKTKTSIKAGGKETLVATVAPANASNKDVVWTTDNPAVATVKDGVVTAVKAGTAKITVTTAEGGKTAVCTVTVTAAASSSSKPAPSSSSAPAPSSSKPAPSSSKPAPSSSSAPAPSSSSTPTYNPVGTVNSKGSALPANTSLVVNQATPTQVAVMNAVATAYKGELALVVDLNLVDGSGNPVAPDGNTLVRVDVVGATARDKVVIAHMLPDGKLEYITGTAYEGYITFKPTSFSPYGIILQKNVLQPQAPSSSAPAAPAAPTTNTTAKSPQTGVCEK